MSAVQEVSRTPRRVIQDGSVGASCGNLARIHNSVGTGYQASLFKGPVLRVASIGAYFNAEQCAAQKKGMRLQEMSCQTAPLPGVSLACPGLKTDFSFASQMLFFPTSLLATQVHMNMVRVVRIQGKHCTIAWCRWYPRQTLQKLFFFLHELVGGTQQCTPPA